jgi:hypothetical protein
VVNVNSLYSVSNLIAFTQHPERVVRYKHCLGVLGEFLNLIELETP